MSRLARILTSTRDFFVNNRKAILFPIVGMTLFISGYKLHPKPAPVPPPPQPIVVEWEVDGKYGDKFTKLPNGLTLTLFVDQTGNNEGWSWSVSGQATSENEAREKLFHMGGVK